MRWVHHKRFGDAAKGRKSFAGRRCYDGLSRGQALRLLSCRDKEWLWGVVSLNFGFYRIAIFVLLVHGRLETQRTARPVQMFSRERSNLGHKRLSCTKLPDTLAAISFSSPPLACQGLCLPRRY